MKELHDFMMENLPVPAQREYLHEADTASSACEIVTTQMASVYNPWHAAYEVMAHVYELPLGSAETTKTIFQLDAQRDQLLYGIEVITRSAMKSPNPAMVAAADSVEQARVSFPVDPNAGYLSQTAQIDTFVNVLLTEQLENVTAINLLPVVQNLKAINDQIHDLVASRDTDRALRGELPSRPVARQAAIDRWRYLMKYVNGYIIITLNGEATPELAEFVDVMNAKAERYKSIYFGGSSKPEDKPADGETTPPAEGDQQPDNTPDTNPDDTNQGDNSQGGSGSLTPDTNPPSGGDTGGDNTGGGNTNPGGGYVPPSNGGGFD